MHYVNFDFADENIQERMLETNEKWPHDTMLSLRKLMNQGRGHVSYDTSVVMSSCGLGHLLLKEYRP